MYIRGFALALLCFCLCLGGLVHLFDLLADVFDRELAVAGLLVALHEDFGGGALGRDAVGRDAQGWYPLSTLTVK